MQDQEQFECVIVGGGPAGLSAAIYLARFRRRTLVIDGGQSRAAIIPRTRNVPGFPEGIAGADLLDLMRGQAERYGANLVSTAVEAITGTDGRFLVKTSAERYSAQTLLFATGVANLALDFSDHDEAVGRGKLRYCPICDGYEVIGKRIAVVGNSVRSAGEVAFLRTYTDDITLFASDDIALAVMRSEKVEVEHYVRRIALDGDEIAIETARGLQRFEGIYSCLGVVPQSAQAARLGARLDATGAILTNERQRTSVHAVYAAGDVVAALDQIAVASGHAAIAATSMHNDLRQL
jgi:thioredoxin reductase (NADPH)